MGKNHPEVSTIYEAFLKDARTKYRAKGKDNFFNGEHVKALKEALKAELQATLNEVRGLPKPAQAAQQQGQATQKPSGLARFKREANILINRAQNAVSDLTSEVMGDHNIDSVDNMIKEIKEKKKRATAFVEFVEEVMPAINRYLNLTNFDFNTKAGLKEFLDLYNALSTALKEYRHKAKSHHYFRSTVGRAEIANKTMGGSLERWLNYSLDGLTKAGTEIDINDRQKYYCVKEKDLPYEFVLNKQYCSVGRNYCYINPPLEG